MDIHLYTEPGCGACIEAKSFLHSRGISFEERDVRAHPEYLRILTDDLDSCALPTLVAGDMIIAGFDRELYQRLAAVTALKINRRSAGIEFRKPARHSPSMQKKFGGGKKR